MSEILFTPIIPISHENVWAQAYKAGNLMTLLVLKNPEEDTDLTLAHKGKEMIRTLEAEFFSLEVKTLVTVTKACDEALKDHEDLVTCFIVGVTLDNVFYLYIYGDGQILLARKGTIGTMTHEEGKTKTSLSGFLEHNDIILFADNEFFNAIPLADVSSLLTPEHAAEFGEDLLPKVHESDNPLAVAALAIYHNNEIVAPDEESEEAVISPQPTISKETLPTSSITPDSIGDNEDPIEVNHQPSTINHERQKHTPTHNKRLIVTILVLVIIAFGTSLFFFMKHTKDQKQQDEYTQFVAPAQKTLTDATALMSVNPLIANQDVSDAKKALTSTLPYFDKGSVLYNQTQASIQQADTLLTQTTTDAATTVTSTADPLLAYLVGKNDITAATEDTTYFYTSDASGIHSHNQKTNVDKVLIKTDTIGNSVNALQVYNGNVYALTSDGHILKFTGSSYTKSSYLGDTTLSGAKSMTIDSDVWVGYNNGSIEKYTRGKKQDFSVSGMQKPLASADILTTAIPSDTLYVVDKSNGSVTLIIKSGTYQKTIVSTELKGATTAILTTDGSLQFLSGGKIYQLSVK